jgi:hypothetical protein
MPDTDRLETGCLLLAEYCDESEHATPDVMHRSEVVRPNVVASPVEVWDSSERLRDFTVMLRDGRTINVRGHGVSHVQKHGSPGDYLCIFVRSDANPVTVATFDNDQISGIFHGTIQERAIA